MNLEIVRKNKKTLPGQGLVSIKYDHRPCRSRVAPNNHDGNQGCVHGDIVPAPTGGAKQLCIKVVRQAGHGAKATDHFCVGYRFSYNAHSHWSAAPIGNDRRP